MFFRFILNILNYVVKLFIFDFKNWIFLFYFRGIYYNFGIIRYGFRKREDNIYLDYEEGGNCKNGKKYFIYILMMCGEREVLVWNFLFCVYFLCFLYVLNLCVY